MNTSLFELFKVGIGPSSSHTVGPMRAARRFVRDLFELPNSNAVSRVAVDLYGSLALTGTGHATDRAVLLGLMGEAPDTVNIASVDSLISAVRSSRTLELDGSLSIPFVEATDLLFHRDRMYPDPAQATHPNGLRCTAFDAEGKTLLSEVFYSVGGGFILSAEEFANAGSARNRDVPYPFSSAAQLLAMADAAGLSIAEVVLANEAALIHDPDIHYRIDRILALSSSARERKLGAPLVTTVSSSSRVGSAGRQSETLAQPLVPGASSPEGTHASRYPKPSGLGLSGRAKEEELQPLGYASSVAGDEATIEAAILVLWQVMSDSIDRGIRTEGTLPGGLNVRRRAPGLAARLKRLDAEGKTGIQRDPLAPLDSVTLVAMAVNEENAAGGRVVTAPTNGAAGVVPALAYYFLHHASAHLSEDERQAGLLRYFLTAAAIGILYKENASISGAEVGCQGEVGVACSMAAGGLVAALTPPPDSSLSAEARAQAITAANAAVEHAAEIAMEHNLGMTCDPIGGLVQIPCIERNGMGAVKAVNAARLAAADPGVHKVSLDQVIDTMYRTGMDMQSRYKETSLAGLALNIIEC